MFSTLKLKTLYYIIRKKQGHLVVKFCTKLFYYFRVKRKPLKETRTVSTEHNGDYVQLNQYKLQVITIKWWQYFELTLQVKHTLVAIFLTNFIGFDKAAMKY